MIEATLEEDVSTEFRGGTLRLKKAATINDAAHQSLDKHHSLDKNIQGNSGDKNNGYWGAIPLPLSSLSSKSWFKGLPNKIRKIDDKQKKGYKGICLCCHLVTESLWSVKPKPVSPPAYHEPPKPSETRFEPPTKVQTSTSQNLQPRVNIDHEATNFFTFRDGVVERAAHECVEEFLDPELEGPVVGSFLLTQINHWDTDKERLVILTHKTLLVVKYDFIALKRLSCKKLPLQDVEAVIVGNLIYPSGSLIPNRNMKGIRILFANEGKPVNFASKWNPFREDIPVWTFTFHPLYFHKDCTDENIRKTYGLDNFTDEFLKTFIEQNKINETRVLQSNILLENYVGLGAIIHNRHDLGFFKEMRLSTHQSLACGSFSTDSEFQLIILNGLKIIEV